MSNVVRLYVNGDSLLSLLAINSIPSWVGEFQVALAFARDYDENDINTNGFFTPYWGGTEVTSRVIAELKAKDSKIKVLVSIGNRDARYPFKIEPRQRDSWISNAFKSLKNIILTYGLDGIDVYYEQIDSEKGARGDFVDAIGRLIEELKSTKVADLASIAPSAPVNANFYYPLYRISDNFIDNVVYQSYNKFQPITTIRGFFDLYNTLVINEFYPSEKLLAGYSNDPNDRSKVSPPLYFIGIIFTLLGKKVNGPSIWTISDSVTTFPPQWIIEIITLVLNLPEQIRNDLGAAFDDNQ